MNKLFILLFALLTVHVVHAQGCLPEGITFTTQEQIDNFQSENPGCTEIEGNVIVGRITESTDISNLNGLNVLTSIGGDLMIYGNYYLTSLDGLENLTSIGGSFSTGIIPNVPLIWFRGSGNLTNIEALNNLTYLGGDLKIWGTGLSNLSGLEGLASIPGNLQIGTYVEWPTLKAQAGGNRHLKNIDGIENIISVGGNLQLEFNDSLTDIASLNENISIDTLIIRYNSSLSECAVQTVCNHLSQETSYSIIDLNAPGCNSPEEVEQECMSHCLPEGIIFTTQAQIDSFAINYPNCTEIGGTLLIGDLGGSDITNLNGLSVLTSIGGNLRIGFNEGMVPGSNPLLTSLVGLDNLEYIGGMLEVVHNSLLTNFIGLGSLMSIGGNLEISGNDTLTSLTGLDNLTSIGGDAKISGYSGFALTSLTGLDNLTSIGGTLRISYTALQTLSGLNNLNSIGSLQISGNPWLMSLTGIDGINAGSITSGIGINVNGLLSTCEVQSICDYLSAPGAYVNIWNNAPGCNSVEEVEEACLSHCLPEGITFTTQAQIDSFAINYPTCAEIEGDVWIGVLPETDITNLNGLNVLNSIGGSLEIAFNKDLTNLTGLDNLTSIGGDLKIGSNNALVSLTGLERLTSIGGNLEIGFQSGMLLLGNPSLTSLEGLANLTSLGGNLHIAENLALTSLTGLDNIEANSVQYVFINYNSSLTECDVQSICDYLASPNGTIIINNNAPGCNSQLEVEDACASFVADMEEDHAISIYPNPVTNELFIVCSHGIQLTEVNIYTQMGQKALQRMGDIRQLNVSSLARGLYVIEFVTEKSKIHRKLVVE
ncbi:MAG: T9SS type A sorting domain-containing protein [Bacteroidales bacterium]|jgi:hypothetical protein|nr:T9SS type A sorting domain-containing protein [Bacteroidales bacterium]